MIVRTAMLSLDTISTRELPAVPVVPNAPLMTRLVDRLIVLVPAEPGPVTVKLLHDAKIRVEIVAPVAVFVKEILFNARPDAEMPGLEPGIVIVDVPAFSVMLVPVKEN